MLTAVLENNRESRRGFEDRVFEAWTMVKGSIWPRGEDKEWFVV